MLAAPLWLALARVAADPAAVPPAVEIPKAVDQRLKIELFAADPDLVTPTGLAIDAVGACSSSRATRTFAPKTTMARRPIAFAFSPTPTAMAAATA